MEVEMETRGGLKSGDTITLQSYGTDITFPESLYVQKGSVPNTYHFTCKSGRNLRVMPTGEINNAGATGPLATWILEKHDNNCFAIYPVAYAGFPNTSGGKNWYLGYKNGKWVGNTGNDSSGMLTIAQQEKAPFVDPLTTTQKEEFINKGYLVIKNVVPQEIVHKALYRINAAMGSEEYTPNPLLGRDNFSDKVKSSEEMMAPYRHPSVINIARSLLGETNVASIHGAQIALRFPSYLKDNLYEGRWHLDGLKQIPEGKTHPFSALIGVCLSDQSQVGNGNLRVYPSSHFTLQQPYKDAILQVKPFNVSEIAVGTEEHVLLSPGDVVVVHPLVAHGVGQVLTPNIRYQLFYRVRHVNHTTSNTELLDDIFFEYEGLRPLVNGRGQVNV